MRRYVLALVFLALLAPPARPDAPPPLLLAIDGSPVKGDTQARVIIVEFSDYQ